MDSKVHYLSFIQHLNHNNTLHAYILSYFISDDT